MATKRCDCVSSQTLQTHELCINNYALERLRHTDEIKALRQRVATLEKEVTLLKDRNKSLKRAASIVQKLSVDSSSLTKKRRRTLRSNTKL